MKEMARSRNGIVIGLAGSELEDFGAHFLAGLEFNDGALGNGNVGGGCIWVAPDACATDFDFKDAKVAQFHLVALGNGLRDVIKGFLNNIQNLLLHKAGFGADPDYQVTLCHSHTGLARVERLTASVLPMGIIPVRQAVKYIIYRNLAVKTGLVRSLRLRTDGLGKRLEAV